MKVVFLQDVRDVAQAGDVKTVADGYGRNYLLPRKLAALAEPSITSVVAAQTAGRVRLEAKSRVELVELAGQLEEKEIVLQAKAGAKERLFGSVTTADIADELQKSTGLVVDKKKLELTQPIHQLGSYEVTIRLAGDITPKIKVTVKGEESEQGV